MPPIPGNILGPRVNSSRHLTACKYPGGEALLLGTFGESCTQGRQAPFVPWGVTDPWTGWPVRGASETWALVIALQHPWWTGTQVVSTECPSNRAFHSLRDAFVTPRALARPRYHPCLLRLSNLNLSDTELFLVLFSVQGAFYGFRI